MNREGHKGHEGGAKRGRTFNVERSTSKFAPKDRPGWNDSAETIIVGRDQGAPSVSRWWAKAHPTPCKAMTILVHGHRSPASASESTIELGIGLGIGIGIGIGIGFGHGHRSYGLQINPP